MKINDSQKNKSTTVRTRNKELTKRLFIDAAFQIITDEGISGLSVNKIAEKAGRSRRMLYDYFGGLDGLLNVLLKEHDNWLQYGDRIESILEDHSYDNGKEFSALVLKNHFRQFYNNKLFQEVALLELNSQDDFLRDHFNLGETIRNKLFQVSEEYFKYKEIDIRIVQALLIGGINFMILHAKSNNNTFFGLNINNLETQKKVLKTVEYITNWTYEFVEKIIIG